MRKTAGLIILLSVGGYAVSAGAQLRGSDTLEGITKALLANAACNGGGLTYLGGGTTTGEDAMRAGTQNIAPMSRALNNNTAVCTTAGGSSTAEGMLFALDGMTIVADSEQTECCGSTGKIHASRGNTLVNPTAAPLTETTPASVPAPVYSDMGADWNVKLRQIYWGLPGTSGTSGANCNSAERQALFNNYKSLFPNNCGGTSGQANTCTGIQHAFRRGDQSGTTDLFRSLLGAGTGSSAVPFCNGNDQQDRDPLRRVCTNAEQVCSADGQLGLVIPIRVPEGDDLNVIYPSSTCPDGRFRYAAGPFEDSACCFRNPNGTCKLATLGLKCPQPVTTTNNGPCLNGWTVDQFDGNQLVGARFAFDARAYNLQVRRAGATGELVSYADGTEVLAAFYRIHSTRGGKFTHSNNTALCKEQDATRQIGCLVQAPNSGCSIGFAGGEAVQLRRAEPLALNGVDWTDATVQNLVSGGTPVYPLARKLYLNTIKGFQTLTGAERNLAACFSTPSTINPLIDQFGFTRLPSQDPVCEEACPNGPAGAHCSGNPAPFN